MLKRIQHIAIFLVGLSLCFSELSIAGSNRDYTLGFLMVAIYFLSLMPVILNYTGRAISIFRPFFVLPLLFFVLLSIVTAINNEMAGASLNMSLFSCIIMFYLFLIQGVMDYKAINYCLWGYGLGAVLLIILFGLGIGIEYNSELRLKMFGSNPNEIGICVCMGMFIVLHEFILKDSLHINIFRFLFLIPICLAFPLLIATGSRTALLLLIIMTFICMLLIPSKRKLLKIVLIICGVFIMFKVMMSVISGNTEMALRLSRTLEEGNTGGRVELWETYWPYIKVNPIFGIGQSGFQNLGKSLGVYSASGGALSPHNVIIEIALYTGAVGLFIMLSFWWKIVKSAFVVYKQFKYSLPILLSFPLLVSIMTAQILVVKFAWFIYAYIIITKHSLSSLKTD